MKEHEANLARELLDADCPDDVRVKALVRLVKRPQKDYRRTSLQLLRLVGHMEARKVHNHVIDVLRTAALLIAEQTVTAK